MASRPASRWHVTCNGSSPTANPSLRSDRAGFSGLLRAMKTCWTRLSKANSQARPAERMLVEIGLMDVYRTGSQPPGGHASILACAKHSSGASRHSETPPNEVCGRKIWKVFYLIKNSSDSSKSFDHFSPQKLPKGVLRPSLSFLGLTSARKCLNGSPSSAKCQKWHVTCTSCTMCTMVIACLHGHVELDQRAW